MSRLRQGTSPQARDAEAAWEPPSGEPWTGEHDAESVIATLEPLVLPRRRERLLGALAARLDSVTVLMESPHRAHNVAAVIRSCDAFGVQRVHVIPERATGRVPPLRVSPVVARGSQKWVDAAHHETREAALACLNASGHELIATHPDGELLPADLRALPRVALILGNEHEGISPELAAAARRSVRVPMRGFVESLNVSVTAAILLAAATQGRAGDLSAAEQRRLYARGLFFSVPRADDVLTSLAARRS